MAIISPTQRVPRGFESEVLGVYTNRHLAELGAIFTAGVKIILPDLTQEEETESVKLWS